MKRQPERYAPTIREGEKAWSRLEAAAQRVEAVAREGYAQPGRGTVLRVPRTGL
jgi:hypothetical protein